MTKSIFCLSLPGGHMTYVGTLTKLLLNHISVDNGIITRSGSAHGANSYFPLNLEDIPSIKDWDTWYDYALKNFTVNDVCVIKHGWGLLSLNVWGQHLNKNANNVCILSNSITKLDWCYCYFNMVNKIPRHVVGRLKSKKEISYYIWGKLKKNQKIKMLSYLMPPCELHDDIELQIPTYKFPTTQILDENFVFDLNSFLTSLDFKTTVTDEIIEFHQTFVSKQMHNLVLAKRIVSGDYWEPRGPFDQILFNWLNTNPWEE